MSNYHSITIGDLEAGDTGTGDSCTKCKRVYRFGDAVFTDATERLFCNALCIENWEQDRAEAANEERHTGEGPRGAEELRAWAAGYLRGRR